jgi:hypothetical protein
MTFPNHQDRKFISVLQTPDHVSNQVRTHQHQRSATTQPFDGKVLSEIVLELGGVTSGEASRRGRAPFCVG